MKSNSYRHSHDEVTKVKLVLTYVHSYDLMGL